MLIKSLNTSIAPSDAFHLTTSSSLNMKCFFSKDKILIIGFFITYITITLPLCILVIYHSLREWKQQDFTLSSVSHSDCFTYHTIALGLVSAMGCIICGGGICRNDFTAICAGGILWYYSWYGETFFHTLTCVEHYLAVVHPITYLKLRSKRMTRIRNITTASIWLICFLGLFAVINEAVFITLSFSLMILVLIVVSFCSLSVLYVLIRPGPGEQQGDRESVDQSKKRAFYTITAVLGVLVLRFLGSLGWTLVYALEPSNDCLIMSIIVWLTLPSSLVKPLLFLHKAGKSVCFKVHLSS